MRKYLILTKILLLTVLATCAGYSYAQSTPYNGPTVYGLKGNVKSVSTTPDPKFYKNKIEFTKEGLIKWSWSTLIISRSGGLPAAVNKY